MSAAVDLLKATPPPLRILEIGSYMGASLLTWADAAEFDKTAQKLANLFHDNFKKFEDGASEEIRNAGPVAKATV